MRKITDFIIDKRYFILVLMIGFTILCTFLETKVKVNYDMAEYLPKTSETRKGMDIMEEEFKDYPSSSLNIMFQGLKEEEKTDIYNYLEKIKGVSEVDYDDSSEYNKDDYTLYVLSLDCKKDSKTAASVYDNIQEHFQDYTFYTSGDVAQSNGEVLPIWIVGLAIFCALIILIIMCESYVEPFLFLTAILMAVLLNNGTNIIFNNVSNITKSISAILQLALSMDYSIMLITRYEQEKEQEKDKIKAMKNALHHAFQSISSSSVTTIGGLLALVFMSFTIGKDLGLVLAKGVLFSLVCIFLVLPTLILMFDKLIGKTKKKTPIIKMNKIGAISYKMRYIAVPLFLIICGGSYILKGNLGFFYTNQEEDKIGEVFVENNQMAIIYKNEDEEKVKKYLDKIDDDPLVDEVLAYSNTINEELTYDKLKTKLKDLGSEVEIPDYLLKIIYYYYFNKETENKITLEEFVNFVEDYAYQNEELQDLIKPDMKNNITKLKNFVMVNNLSKKKSGGEIASILDISKSKTEDLMIYYLALNKSNKMTTKEFVDFINKDVLTNSKYKTRITEDNKEKLDKLNKFIKREDLEKELDYKEMADLFGIEEAESRDLYKYYINLSDIDLELTINKFTNFVINNVMDKEEYQDLFDSSMKQDLELLNNFSNKSTITTEMNSKSLASYLGVREDLIKQLLLLKYKSVDSGAKLSLQELILGIEKLQTSSFNSYLEGVDLSNLEKIREFALNENDFNTQVRNKEQLIAVFDKLSPGLVEKFYTFGQILDGKEMTNEEFIDNLIIFAQNYPGAFDEEKLKSLQIIQWAIKNGKEEYTASDMATNLGISKQDINGLYALICLSTNKTDNWQASLNELVKLMLTNKDNDLLKTSIDNDTWANLEFLNEIMDSTLNNKKYTYKQLSRMLDIDKDMVKDIYTLYIDNKGTTKLKAQEFEKFILEHKDDQLLAGIDQEKINDLLIVDKVIEGVLENKQYNYLEMTDLLGVNKEDVKLLYGLYDYKYIDKNYKITLKDFINYLLKDVVTNEEYKKEFSNKQITELKTLQEIMNNINKKYGAKEAYQLLRKLSDDLEQNTMEMLYIYYGGEKKYDESYTLTVQEFVRFLNKEIIQNEKFKDFIDDDENKEIKEAQKEIDKAQNLIRGDNYSRIVINTKYEKEGKDTFNFLVNLKNTFKEDMTDFYVIGDSPMAYDMSTTFDRELNYITVITIIIIFIVVAFTFKSLLIPAILVLVIQCAVYLTMGILSLMGDNVYFIAILIVQSILMGATIDYAILYTSYYLEERKTMGVKDSVINAYNNSIHTIITSASILIIVTLIVGHFASAIAAKICITISQGTLCSALLILILLPAVLAAGDKIIVKKKIN